MQGILESFFSVICAFVFRRKFLAAPRLLQCVRAFPWDRDKVRKRFLEIDLSFATDFASAKCSCRQLGLESSRKMGLVFLVTNWALCVRMLNYFFGLLLKEGRRMLNTFAFCHGILKLEHIGNLFFLGLIPEVHHHNNMQLQFWFTLRARC